MRYRVHKALAALAIAVAFPLTTTAANAHFTVHRAGHQWYFDGRGYQDIQLNQGGDPIDLAFTQNLAGTQKATLTNVNGAFAAHWVGPNHMSSTALCISPPPPIEAGSSDEYMAWHAFASVNGVNSTDPTIEDENILNGALLSWNPCNDEYHIRFWTDLQHQLETGFGSDKHGALNQWVIGGAHHESKPLCCLVGHSIDKPWDQVRNDIIRYMPYYCGRRQFRYDAASYGLYGSPGHRFWHDGWIGDLSLQARSQGC